MRKIKTPVVKFSYEEKLSFTAMLMMIFHWLMDLKSFVMGIGIFYFIMRLCLIPIFYKMKKKMPLPLAMFFCIVLGGIIIGVIDKFVVETFK